MEVVWPFRSLYAPALQSLCVERIALDKVPPIFTEKPLWVCYGQIWALPNRGITYAPEARVGGWHYAEETPRSLDSWSVPILLLSTVFWSKVRELATSLGLGSIFEHTSWSWFIPRVFFFFPPYRAGIWVLEKLSYHSCPSIGSNTVFWLVYDSQCFFFPGEKSSDFYSLKTLATTTTEKKRGFPLKTA